MTAWADPGCQRIYRLDLPWPRPPLNANQRLHWTARHLITREIRDAVAWLARDARIPPADHVVVTLNWAPGDRRRRDADNAVPTLKAACDGLVDARIVPDDTPSYMDKRMPVITHPGPACVWLDVEITHPVTHVGMSVADRHDVGGHPT